jgi:hypothetical protein
MPLRKKIELNVKWGKTDKVAVDSPINQQQKQGKQDNECKGDSTIADANHDNRIDAEHQERPDLSEGRRFHPSRVLWRKEKPALLKPVHVQNFFR